MDTTEAFVRERLRSATAEDIVFLKKQWNGWIAHKNWLAFERKTGANPQVVYGVLDELRIKQIRRAILPSLFFSVRYEVRLRHSMHYDIFVVLVFDQPASGNIGIVTYYKKSTSQKNWFI